MLSDDAEHQERLDTAIKLSKARDTGDMTGEYSVENADEGLMQYVAVIHAMPVSEVR